MLKGTVREGQGKGNNTQGNTKTEGKGRDNTQGKATSKAQGKQRYGEHQRKDLLLGRPKERASENKTETKENTVARPKWRARSMRTLQGRPMQEANSNGQRECSTEGQNQRPKRTQ